VTDVDVRVSGGAGGVTARIDDLQTLGALSDDLALTLTRVSVECHEALVNPDVLASALLDPAGVATFEKALLIALDGPGGLSALAAGFTEQAIGLRATALAYYTADEAEARGLDALRWAGGYATGLGLQVAILNPPLLAELGLAYAGYRMSGGNIDLDQLLTEHPGLVDNVVGGAPGLISELTPFTLPNVRGAAATLGLLYPDGVPVGQDAGTDTAYDAAHGAPNSFADLMGGLQNRDNQSHDGGPDQIDVRVITHPDGTRSYIVDIPGTKTWDAPGDNRALDDFGTNIHGIAGETTAREQAVADALRRAGAGPTDPVMLVGHSQGGLIAAQAAHDTTTGTFGYNVTHVVTAGSPVGRVDVPAGVQMLSLENSHDIVPHLDAADNRDRANITTVTFDLQNGSIGANHGMGSAYLPGAQALDASSDPSVRAYRDSAGAFLDSGAGTTTETKVYDYYRQN